ncbi:hypothetical protein QN277_007588 [Acacia crassicarpa]|uniref:Protein SIEVE ELEMENT OCCLUSION B-like n=1 Tax=Acacia crassicarpa TaxID=499986 RepID=A0AAE1IW76_9FABA|nr:hypothetical protein QN277_007588 [Acacia crassicarpa]
MVKPLTLEDKDVLKLVYDEFVVSSSNQLEKPFDHEALFTNVVSDVFVRSLRTFDPITEFDLPKVEKTTAKVEPPIYLLKHLACQMRDTKREDENRSNAHVKTMWVLKTLDSYSWCAKAVIALAAFGLEFGVFWDLYEQKISAARKDSLGYSLAVLNNVNEFDATKKAKDILGYNDVVKNVYKTVRLIVDLGRVISLYDSKNLPTLLEVMHIYSTYVYWTVLAIVVLASQLDVLSGAPYNLTDISTKISSVRLQLEDYQKTIEREIEKWKEYRDRENCAFVSPKDIVQVLKCLLFPIYQDLPKGIIEVFKANYVLVFISGLYSIDDEINLLNKIYEELKQSRPRIVTRYRKDKTVMEFEKDRLKILWAPIVHEDSDEVKRRFDVMSRKMKWHVVDYTIIPQLCKDLIKNRLKYDNMNPIVPLFSPQGELLNDNALHMLFTWGIQAFPWRPVDAPVEKSNWIWNELQKSNHSINTWLNENAYIIVSGRTDSDGFDDQWVMKLPGELEKIKNDDIIRRFDIIIRYCRHGEKDKDESETIAKFWTYVESTFDGLRRMNKEEVDEETFRQVKLFLGVRRHQTGWVVLSKGASVKRICHSELFYQTLTEFSKWRQNIENDPGFDVSLLNYYDRLESQQKPLKCIDITLKTHLSNIYKSIICPDPKCQRPMKFKSAVFECCHGQDEVARAADHAGGGEVEITRPDS